MSFYAKEKNCPRCKKHIDCKANYSGKCIALNNTDFGNRDCPFYKSRIDAYNKKEERDGEEWQD